MMMAGRCKKTDCNPDLTCVLGEVDRSECEHWQSNDQEAVTEPSVLKESIGVPWNGVAAGTNDLAYIAARGRPRIVGLVGPYDAGKTTFLAIFYSQLLRRGHLGGRLCAGSYTLAGWEGIARYMRRAPGRPATFPPHTSSYATRQPGLLHLAIRTGERLEDVFFTDAPGEWFTEWAKAETSSAAEGARWIAERSGVFLLFVDSQAIADTKTRGEARSQYQMLVERCSSLPNHRPLLMIRTKSDVALAESQKSFLAQRQIDFLPRAVWHDVTKDSPDGIFDTMLKAIEHALVPSQREHWTTPFPITRPEDAFLSFRGHQ